MTDYSRPRSVREARIRRMKAAKPTEHTDPWVSKRTRLTTARKRSCWKVAFLHLAVILLTGGYLSRGRCLCPGEGVSVQGEVSLSRGGGLCPGEGVSVQGRGSLSGESMSREGISVRETPHTLKSGRYASYWNTFL